MTRNAFLRCGWALALTLVVTTALQAQRRRDFSPADFVKSLDKNGNGTIEGDEMSGRARGFIERAAERGGLDMNQPLPIDKLTEAFAQGREERGGDRGRDDDSDNDRDRDRDRDRDSDRDRDRGDDRRDEGDRNRDSDRDRDRNDSDRDRDRSRSDSRTPQPRTPGFGVADNTPKAAGFDVPLGQDNAYIEKRFERKVIEYVDRMLGEQDTNKDGFIDNIEWKVGKWSTPPETSDTNNDKRLSKLELCVRIGKRFGGDRELGQPAPSSGSGPSKENGGNSTGGGDAAKYRAYAEGLIKQHDNDKSGMLEKSKGEWEKLKDDQRDADSNKDSVITMEELIVKLQAYSSGSSRSSSASSSGSSSSRSNGSSRSGWWKKEATAKEEPKKSYRFLSPTERLPKGLPDWFARNDADGDGQIMMSEFAAAWTETTAVDFTKHDRDGDGIITPDEALQANQK